MPVSQSGQRLVHGVSGTKMLANLSGVSTRVIVADMVGCASINCCQRPFPAPRSVAVVSSIAS